MTRVKTIRTRLCLEYRKIIPYVYMILIIIIISNISQSFQADNSPGIFRSKNPLSLERGFHFSWHTQINFRSLRRPSGHLDTFGIEYSFIDQSYDL